MKRARAGLANSDAGRGDWTPIFDNKFIKELRPDLSAVDVLPPPCQLESSAQNPSLQMKMKYLLLLVPLMVAQTIATHAQPDPSQNILIRLVAVSHTSTEISILVAKFVPISSNNGGGGGRGPDHPFGEIDETKTAKEFTIVFRNQSMNPHYQTIWNVINSCEAPRGSNTLRLNLLLSVPADVPRTVDYSDVDFSRWIVQSIEPLK